MRSLPAASPPLASSRLGDWYANLIHYGRRQLILCVSERTLLPVILPAAEARSLPSNLPKALAGVLSAVGVSAFAIDQELREMTTSCIGPTRNRRVLGSMNDFANMAEVSFDRNESLLMSSLLLAECPCSPIDMENPRSATLAVFGGH